MILSERTIWHLAKVIKFLYILKEGKGAEDSSLLEALPRVGSVIHCPIMILRDYLRNMESIMHDQCLHSTNVSGSSLFSGNDLDMVPDSRGWQQIGREINWSAWWYWNVYSGGTSLPKEVGKSFSKEMTFELCFEGWAVSLCKNNVKV